MSSSSVFPTYLATMHEANGDVSVKSWQNIAAAKKAQQNSRIPSAWKLQPKDSLPKGTADARLVASSCGILKERELEITSSKYDATSLAAEIATGSFSAEEVVTAFCKRAAIGHQLCNNLTEIMFVDAIEDAKKLDEHFRVTGKTVGPLHGLPMTFKECFHVKGYDASNGYISRTFSPSTTTTYAIEVVKAAGAVIISKTNTPQTMIVAEAENNVFGRTKNPVVHHLTSGGSSGGEGSNMAFRGSAIGIGTDVGGSIRIPAAANGTYGFKPSAGILPFIGYAASGHTGSNTGIPAVLGPIANSLRDLSLLVSTMRAAKPWTYDPAVIPYIFEQCQPLATNSKVNGIAARKPIVGIIHSSGLTPHPPIKRGILEAEAKLKAAGFDIVPFNPPDFTAIREITSELFTLDALSYARGQLERAGEPVVESVTNIGFWSKPRKTMEEAWALNTRLGEVKKQMLDEWMRTKVDVVLCPVGPHTAVAPGKWSSDHYTVVWNAVDYPAVIIPFTRASAGLDSVYENFVPLSELDMYTQSLYDAKLMDGAPVGLQIVGIKWGDAQLLKDAEIIDEILNR